MADNLYEAMFVVDAATGGARFPDAVRHIADLLTRHGAEIERIEKWDERKLAYPIKRVKRGIYILVYFRSDGSAISEMRRMIALSEEVLRSLILKAEEPSAVKGQLFDSEGQLLESPEEEAVTTEPEEPAAETEKKEPEEPESRQAEQPAEVEEET